MPAWMGGRGGRPEGYCHRVMIDAVLYVVDNGIKWRALPVDFPAWDAVYRFFRRWRDQGLTMLLHDRLRRAVRVADGRDPEPSAAIIDSQSLRAAETVGGAQRGYDGGKKINGTKRHVVVDTLGLLLTVLVTAASVFDRDGAQPLLHRMRMLCPRVRHVWADGGYAGALIGWAAQHLRLRIEVVRRTDKTPGFVVLPRRWVVERSLGWLTRRRRLVRDYERLPHTHETMVRWAMIPLMTRRLTKPDRPRTPRNPTA
ncbi:IS5 family transposase [Catenulispora subtropica]|uniref:IS5 family transposase n=1 Tax=Catenulispora subtropica TaxID=450798 RepID=A0ABP5CFT7_9ACTN